MLFHSSNFQIFFKVCSWHNRECKLNLHYEYGLKLFDLNQNNSLLWQQSFDKLRRSADNNQNLLWLDFENDEGEIVIFIYYFYVVSRF